MPRAAFIGQSSRDPDNIAAATSRLVNCYIEPIGGRSQFVLKSVLGMSAFTAIDTAFLRAVREIGGVVYVVQNGGLYNVREGGTVTFLGSVADDENTTISSNDGNVTVAAGGNYYVWDGTSITKPASGAFDNFGSVTYYKNKTVLTERNGNRVQWSDVFDPATLNGLNFATADTYDDKAIRGEVVGDSLYIFKENSIETWYQQGADLVPVVGGASEYGLKSFNLFTRLRNGAFFVSSDGKARLIFGGMQVVSNRAVETSLQQQEPTHCFFYEDEGHSMCVIRFAERPAWVYDIATGAWHERVEFGRDDWSAIASFNAFGAWHVAGEGGQICRLERTNQDKVGPLIREATGQTLQIEGDEFCLDKFEVQARMGHSQLGLEEAIVLDAGDGFALDAGDGGALVLEDLTPSEREARIELSISRDFGETFGDPKPRSLGKAGQYNQRAVWRSLGLAKQITPKLTWSDAAEIPVDAEAFYEVS